ncbi:hypothetical protein VCRA2120E57_10143 [Vibrio crassostreae]|nr:hypothetical protein VCRA2120E57_10143 [Vibrio crassostreae]
MSCISATKMIIFFITIFPKYTVNNEPSSLSNIKSWLTPKNHTIQNFK